MPLISQLADDFEAAAIDAVRWPGAAGAASQVGGRARIECGTGYARLVSAAAYTLQDSSVSCWVQVNAAGGATTEAWTQMVVMSSVEGTDLCFEYDGIADVLRLSSRVGYWDEFAVEIPYDPDAHRWWRIREGAAQTRFETSPDGLTWTVRRTLATPGWVAAEDALALQLISHRNLGVVDFAEFDDLNITYASASLTGGGELSAYGHSDGTQPPVVAVQHWQLLAGSRFGGYETELTSARARKLTLRLKDHSQLTFDLDGDDPEVEFLDELQTDIHVLWRGDGGRGKPVFRGRLGSTRDDITTDTHIVQCSVLDYRAVLARRILYSTNTFTWTDTDGGEIAWHLVYGTQAMSGGHLGITKGWTGDHPTGHLQTWEFAPGDNVAERIRQVAEVPDGGFDWDVVPLSASALQLQVWSPYRGTDRDVILEHGGEISAVQREVNPQSYANALRFTGADGLTAVEAAADGIEAEGRWDTVFGDNSLEIQECVDKRAAWQLAEAATVRPTYTVVLKPGAWWGPDHIWLGDPVRLIAHSGHRQIDTTLRVYVIDIDISDEGTETVTLTLDRPPTPPDRMPAHIDRRLTNLERR